MSISESHHVAYKFKAVTSEIRNYFRNVEWNLLSGKLAMNLLNRDSHANKLVEQKLAAGKET